jgi:hypothetical protein
VSLWPRASKATLPTRWLRAEIFMGWMISALRVAVEVKLDSTTELRCSKNLSLNFGTPRSDAVESSNSNP